MSEKKKSHFGKGMIAGAIFGIAAGIYMSSREGKQMAQKLRSRAGEIEKRLHSEFRKNKDLTESAYENAIETVLAYYLRTKKIAKNEIPNLRSYLLGKWSMVKEEMRDVRTEQKAKVKAKSKTSSKRAKKK